MSGRTSESVKLQNDYLIMKEYIDAMLQKETANHTHLPGSIILGKKYATMYHNEINKMLSSEYLDKTILQELYKKVLLDLQIIREDCKKRMYWSKDVNENDQMMSMIVDFIITLHDR
jgi:hypothetical protein